LGTLGVGFFIYTRLKKESGNRIQFIAQGKEAGFSVKETDILRQLAVSCSIEDPCLIFKSQELFEKCIRAMIRSIKMSGEEEEQEIQDILSHLYDYRKKLEAGKPQNKGITNSRQMGEGQFLKVLVPENGVFTSQVVKNNSQSLIISRPVNKKHVTGITWSGSKISIYFWRENDAGYVFDTFVEDEVFSKGVSALKITHSDSLFRTQKRRSIRLMLHKPAYLYLVMDDGEPHELETVPGLKCYLEDISDTGCAVTVGGKTEAGLRVKIQFALGNRAVCMTGTVRSTTYKDDVKRSLLRIEADSLPQRTRNLILGEVFGTQDDSDDDMPFRELDEEAASAANIATRNTSGNSPEASGVSMPDFSAVSVPDKEGIFDGFDGSLQKTDVSDDFSG